MAASAAAMGVTGLTSGRGPQASIRLRRDPAPAGSL